MTSASLLAVLKNPNDLGNGVEAELSLGTTLAVLGFGGSEGTEAPSVVVGIEGSVFARFGLQILERELVATDWVFTVPFVWYREDGWVRFRFFHSSSHLGDEYARRFDDRGQNFSRDALDLFGLARLHANVDVYGGVRLAYNVKPDDSRRWVLRGGVELGGREWGVAFRPFLAADLEWDEDAGPDPRLAVKGGVWLPPVSEGRPLQLSVGSVSGPSSLGQFQGRSATHFFVGLFGYF